MDSLELALKFVFGFGFVDLSGLGMGEEFSGQRFDGIVHGIWLTGR